MCNCDQDGEADAVTLDGGDIYKAGLKNYDLHPVYAEDYGEGNLSEKLIRPSGDDQGLK